MIVQETAVAGVCTVDLEPHEDERGMFARTFCVEELAKHGIDMHVAQASISFSTQRGTLRGLHLQLPPHEEAKLVRCTRGAVFDVAVDVRPESPTFLQWTSVELSDVTRRQLYVPQGCAHGFLTLTPDTEFEYLISTPYAPDAAAGIRWDDPAIGIDWPFEPVALSERDRTVPYVDVDRLRAEGVHALAVAERT